MPIIQLVRHAESANNALYNSIVAEFGGAEGVAASPTLRQSVEEQDALRRSPDPSLSARGFEQAQLLADAISDQSSRCSSTTLVCSPMLRACSTAEPIAARLRHTARDHELKVICHAQLFETGGCHQRGDPLPGRTFRQICDDHPSLRCDEPVAFPSPDCGWFSAATERERDASARVERVYLWVSEVLAALPDTARLVLVGHGAFMAILLGRMMGLPVEGATTMAVHANTGMSTLRFVREKGIFLVLALNDTRHVPPALLTGSDPVNDGWDGVLCAPSWRLARYSGCHGETMPARVKQQALVLRRECLWAREAGVTASAYEESDARAITVIALLQGSDVVVGHVQYDPLTMRLRQLIVLPQFRGLSIGRALVDKVMEVHHEVHHEVQREVQREARGEARGEAGGEANGEARATPPLRVCAWLRSEPFYSRCGFRASGEPYESNGVRCVRMERTGAKKRPLDEAEGRLTMLDSAPSRLTPYGNAEASVSG